MKSLHNVLRHFFTLFFACFLFAFFSCENAVTSATENQMEAAEEKSSQKAYIVLKLVEPNNTAASNARAVTSGVTSSLFSNITFSGTRADGVSITPVTAESFTELAGQSIEVEPGDWTFELEAWLGKTASAAGEKYTASQNLTVVAGTNELKMKLASDSASEAVPTSHPGSWEVAIKFPAETIDQVNVWLLNYSDFAVSGADPASLTKLYSKNYVKGSDFTASGQQTLRAGETNRACGNYIVYVSFLKNVGQQGEDIETEVINNWGEFMRINPGVKSTGTITLPNADKTYTIQYNLGGAQWNPASTENIQISYTRNSGSAGVITLPTQTSFVDRGPLYSFEGWYTDEDFAAGTGPVTSFNVSDAENKIFYAKWHEPVYDIYIQAGADDSIADGSKARPFSTVSLSVYQTFDDITGTNADGTYKSTIHILSDYTGANKITAPWGNGDDSLTGMCVNFVGEKGRVANADVTLDVNVPDNKSFVYVEKAQRIRFSHINITSSKDYTDPNGFGCLSCVNGTELIFEDSTIRGYTAKGCTGINVEGVAYIRNCEISGNYAIDANADAPNPGTGQSNIWGCAVNAKNGFLHIGQNVVIKNNRILKDDGSGEEETESYNLYIGGYESGSLTFTPVIIDSSLDGCEIWVKLAEEPRTFTSGYGTQTEAVSTYFHSDSGMEVRLVSGEARLAAIRHLYVASNGHDDSSADGTETKPYASIAHAIQQLNNNEIDATIYVVDEVLCNTTIVNSGASGGQPLVANSIIIEGTGTDSALNGNANGSVLVLKTSVPITINNLTIKNGSSSNYGGGLYIDGSTIEINNCIIEDNKAVTQGGGVYVATSSSLIMNGSDSLIRNNRVVGDRINPSPVTPETKKGGGGVFIAEGGSFTMNAGTIRGNGTTDSGGGLYIRGNFTMESGTITSNKNYSYNSNQTTLDSNFSDSIKTDNVEIGIPGNFEMKGGTITSELASGGACGGVCVYAEPAFFNDPAGTATFTMSGGLIEGITSSKAAVYLSAISSSELYNLEFNMTGGTIKGNTATGTGGAVSLGKFSHFTMSGGEISGNHAEGSGGGVYLENSTTNAPTITLGVSGKTGDIKIKNNTYGASDTECNIYLKSSDIITVAGPLAATSEVGVTRAGTFSSTPFTSGFGTTNSSTAPADIFTSDEGYTIIAGSGGEAAFLTASASGTIYTPSDYNFTLAASRNAVTVGNAASVTVTPTVTRTEPSGDPTPLFYNPADQKLYLDSAFTYPEGTNSKVTWSASLWCSGAPEYENLSAGIDSDANKFTIPALTYENTYTLNVTATYQGYAHNAGFAIQCKTRESFLSDFVLIPHGSFKRASSADAVLEGKVYTVTISKDYYMCNHEVTQKEWFDIMGLSQAEMYSEDKGRGDDYPVYYVNWYAAITYCNKRSLAEGLDCVYEVSGVDFSSITFENIPTGNNDVWNEVSCDWTKDGYRLPTEAEWEYAALEDYKNNANWNGYGDSSNTSNYVFAGYNGNNGSSVENYAWLSPNSGHITHTVGAKTANSYGLFDMTGNVMEWCWDLYVSNQYTTDGNITDPRGGVSSSTRVMRGGSYGFALNVCPVSSRHNGHPYIRYEDGNGFRVVRNAE